MQNEKAIRHVAIFFIVILTFVLGIDVFYITRKLSVHNTSIVSTYVDHSASIDSTVAPQASPASFLETAYIDPLYSYTPSAKEKYHQIQGACTDGKQIWSGWSSPNGLSVLSVVPLKFDITLPNDSLSILGHANDMTYNPNTNRLYVCSYKTDSYDSSGDILVVDPTTFYVEKTIKLKRNGKMCPVHGIAYDQLNDRYVTATRDSGGRGYAIFNSNFEYLDTVITQRKEDYILQGIETDGRYIYRALWSSDAGNYIAVYDFSGLFVQLISVPVSGADLELEDIMYDWYGNWFLCFSDHAHDLGGSVYTYVGLQSGVDYSQVTQFFSGLRRFLLNTV